MLCRDAENTRGTVTITIHEAHGLPPERSVDEGKTFCVLKVGSDGEQVTTKMAKVRYLAQLAQGLQFADSGGATDDPISIAVRYDAFVSVHCVGAFGRSYH